MGLMTGEMVVTDIVCVIAAKLQHTQHLHARRRFASIISAGWCCMWTRIIHPGVPRTFVSEAGLGMQSMTCALSAAGRPSSLSATSMVEVCLTEMGRRPPAPGSACTDASLQQEGRDAVVASASLGAVYTDLATRTTARVRQMPDAATASCLQPRLTHTCALKKEERGVIVAMRSVAQDAFGPP